MEFLPLIIQLVSGAIGGNAVGAAAKNLSLGTIGNTIAGLLGGAAGGQLLGMLMGGGDASVVDAAIGAAQTADGFDINALVSQVAGGGIGGGVVMAIAGMIKKMMAK